MTSEGLGEMFEGDSADMCTEKFSLVSMGGRAGSSSLRRPRSEDPHQPFFLLLGYNRNGSIPSQNRNLYLGIPIPVGVTETGIFRITFGSG